MVKEQRILFLFKGNYSASEQYDKYDVVVSSSGSYYALQANTNIPVTNETYWKRLIQNIDKSIIEPIVETQLDGSEVKF